jgi:hypothetical protein
MPCCAKSQNREKRLRHRQRQGTFQYPDGCGHFVGRGESNRYALLPGRRNATLLAAPLSYREQDPIDAVAKLAACGLAEDSGILLSLVAICCFAASSQAALFPALYYCPGWTSVF